jgi:hypothetical protein
VRSAADGGYSDGGLLNRTSWGGRQLCMGTCRQAAHSRDRPRPAFTKHLNRQRGTRFLIAAPCGRQTVRNGAATMSLRPPCGHPDHRTAANESESSSVTSLFARVFAPVRPRSQTYEISGRTVRIGLLMRFSSRLLRVCDGRTGSMPGFALVQAGRMPYLTYVRRGTKAFDGSDDGPSARRPDPLATCWWIP